MSGSRASKQSSAILRSERPAHASSAGIVRSDGRTIRQTPSWALSRRRISSSISRSSSWMRRWRSCGRARRSRCVLTDPHAATASCSCLPPSSGAPVTAPLGRAKEGLRPHPPHCRRAALTSFSRWVTLPGATRTSSCSCTRLRDGRRTAEWMSPAWRSAQPTAPAMPSARRTTRPPQQTPPPAASRRPPSRWVRPASRLLFLGEVGRGVRLTSRLEASSQWSWAIG